MQRTIEVRLVRDRRLAGAGASGALVRGARPVAAEGDVEDEALREEVGRDVALRVREERSRGAPGRRVGLLGGNVRGDLIAVKEPDGNRVGLERVRVHATSLHVEEVAEGAVSLLLPCAPGVVPVRGLARSTKEVRQGFGRLVENAAGAAVEGDLVLRVGVHTLCEGGRERTLGNSLECTGHVPMMSISPAFGHSLPLPRDQYAGQTPQPWGIE